jgi:hypothetical protein
MQAIATFIAALFATGALWAQPPAPTAEPPLPDPATFLERVQQRIKSDQSLLSQYTYMEREVERRLNDKGGVTKEDLRISEVYPALEKDELPYRRTISINGKAVPEDELGKKDAERRKKVLAYTGRLQNESEADKRKRLAKEAEREKKEQETIDEILRLFDVQLVARENIDGRPAIKCTVRPRAGYKPRTDDAKFLKKFGGLAWFSESDYELVRAELEVTDDLTFGWGIFARLHKGSRFQLLRRKVNEEVWLPAELRYQVSARIALLKRIRAEGVSTFSDYKKFTVSTSTTFTTPKQP